ncbi:MAG: hypothetical protein ACTHU0_31705 [Kofleriaceae bacterium]
MRVMQQVVVGVLAVMALHSARAWADDEYNFETHSGLRGCASIVFRDRRDRCHDLSAEKKSFCVDKRLRCELSEQKRTLEKYKEAQERLKSMNESDKPQMEEKIRDLRRELDDRKELAKAALPYADGCNKAREAVQTWFQDTIPLTRAAGENATKRRQVLLEKLTEAERRRNEAKEKRDANPNDSELQREFERAIEEVRNVERELERFNQNNGKDIPYYVDRLVRHYVDERASHEQSIADDNKHYENCKEIVNLSY